MWGAGCGQDAPPPVVYGEQPKGRGVWEGGPLFGGAVCPHVGGLRSTPSVCRATFSSFSSGDVCSLWNEICFKSIRKRGKGRCLQAQEVSREWGDGRSRCRCSLPHTTSPNVGLPSPGRGTGCMSPPGRRAERHRPGA